MKSTVENKILVDNQWIPYIIEYKKIKNIYFRVKEDGIIHVSCNKYVSQSYIKNLLEENTDAISRMLKRANNRAVNNSKLFYLGNELRLMEYDGKPYIDNDFIYAKDYEQAKDYIYSLAFDLFNSRLEQIRINFKDLPNFRLRIRKMTTKWGVCNKKSMTVTLNTELITKDVSLIDYVIVHELCHFKYMDHSANFWKYVASFYPYYKQARKELNY